MALVAGGEALAGRADYPEKAKEIIAVTFAKEMMEGGYKAVDSGTAQENGSMRKNRCSS